MATQAAIKAAFVYFEGAGLRAAPSMSDARGLQMAIGVWIDQLAGVSDEDLEAAAKAYSAGAVFWPTIGQIRSLLPKREAPRVTATNQCAVLYDAADEDTRREVLRRINEDIGWPDGDLTEARWAAFFDDVTREVLAGRAA